MKFVDISLPIPVDHPFTYSVADEEMCELGQRVLVTVGRKQSVGLVLGQALQLPEGKCKPIDKVLDSEPLFSKTYLDWLLWASHYYFTPLGEVLAAALPSLLYQTKTKKKAPTSRSSALSGHWSDEKRITLTEEQQQVWEVLQKSLNKGEFAPFLLHGVTGSGKTEIYLQALHEVINQGKQALLLVPEIGLTPQVIGRLQSHFKDMCVYHSGLTENQRYLEWEKFRTGASPLMVGTRSALFAVSDKLGIIIIDEEHDSSYKQEEGFRYHARHLALVRAQKQNCPIILGSATPSLESYHLAKEKKYRLLELKNRVHKRQLPQVTIIDMASQIRQTQSPLNLCRELHGAIEAALDKKEQVLILINRRGFASSSYCLDCRQAVTCKNCSVALPYHKKENRLLCHYCDSSFSLPSSCPQCHGKRMTLLGLGTETIEDEIRSFFPRARIGRLDRDTVKKKSVLLDTLKNLHQGKIDILIGTQMVAKGHDIAGITLVGVVGADIGLGVPDFRASERVFQLVTQVSGRAGRGDSPGKVIVQSFSPDHFSLKAAARHDFEAFFEEEMKWRRELFYSPYSRLVQLRFSSNDEKKMEAFCRNLENWIDKNKAHFKNITILGPSPAPVQRIKGQFRHHLLLKGKNASDLYQATRILLQFRDAKTESSAARKTAVSRTAMHKTKWSIDVDPVSMM